MSVIISLTILSSGTSHAVVGRMQRKSPFDNVGDNVIPLGVAVSSHSTRKTQNRLRHFLPFKMKKFLLKIVKKLVEEGFLFVEPFE